MRGVGCEGGEGAMSEWAMRYIKQLLEACRGLMTMHQLTLEKWLHSNV